MTAPAQREPAPREPAAPPGATPAFPGTGSIVAALAIGLVALAVYASLCPAVSGMGDGSEFTLVLATNGVAHPTGYPLYTLFGHAFVSLLQAAGAPWPLAANLWSALGAAVAVGFLFALAHRLVWAVPGTDAATRFLAALVPVALFAFQPILLIDATAAEVNAWSAAWVSVAGFAFLRLQAAIAAAGGDVPAHAGRGAALWGLVCGAGVAHHLTSVFISVPLTIALAVSLARGRVALPPLALRAALAAGVPVASYGIIAWRAWHPAVVQWPVLAPSLASVWEHVSGAQYRHYMGYFAPAADHVAMLERVVLPFLAVGLVAVAAGFARARDAGVRATWAGLAGGAALVTGFTFRYGVPDPAPYFLPAMAIAAAAAAPLLAALARPRARGAALRLAALAVGAGILVLPWLREAATRTEEIAGFERLVRSMWSAVPADSVIVLWPDDRYQRLREYQLLGGEKPAALVLHPQMLLEDRTRARLRQRFGADPIEGHPIPGIEPGSPDEQERIDRYLGLIVRDFNARIRTPVVIFDPSVPIVQRLRKPWERRTPAAGPGGGHVPVPAH